MPEWLSFLLFFLLTSTFWTGVNLYVVNRFLHLLGVVQRRRRWQAAFLAVAFLYPIGALTERYLLPGGPGGWLMIAGSYHIGGVVLCLCTFFLGDVGLLVARLFRWLRTEKRQPAGMRIRALLAPPPRPQLLVEVAVAALAVAAALWGGHRDPRVVRVEVTAAPGSGLDQAVRIAAFSDVHLGRLVGTRELERIVEMTNALKPDIVLIPGDLFDDASACAADAVPALAGLDAPLGIFMTRGNHEFYVGDKHWRPWIAATPVRILSQEAVQVRPDLAIAGADDRHYRSDTGLTDKESVDRAVAAAGTRGFLVLATHRPDPADEAVALGADLVVTGHTHAGQIPPFQIFAPMSNQHFLHGLYQLGAGTLYVSSGAGTWGPRMRLLAPSEIVEIVVQPGASE
jgi:predicted MPP superfamily phosphohydrolase